MGTLLDMLEYATDQSELLLACDILRVLQRSCQAPEGVTWLRTRFILQQQHEQRSWACTGVGLVVLLWNKVMTTDDNCEMQQVVVDECVRLLNLVLWHLQRQRQRSDCGGTNNDDEEACSFRSVLTEHAELHKSASHATLASSTVSADIQRLVRHALDEIAMDEDELEELRQAVALATN